MKKKTLEQIIEDEKKYRHEDGMFGIKACKESIMIEVKYFKKSLYTLLEEYMKYANSDICFNRAMVLACWELINEQ